MERDPRKNITGDRQAEFAGTNTDRYKEPANADQQNNPIQDEEAQNVTDGQERMSHEVASKDRNKANEGKLDAE